VTKLIRFVKLYEDADLVIKPGEVKKLSEEQADSLVDRGFAEYALGDERTPTNATQKVRLSKNSQGSWIIALEEEGFYLEPQRDRQNWKFRVRDFMTPSRPPAPTSTVTLDTPQKLRTSQSAIKIRDVFKALYDSDKDTQLDETIRLLQDNSYRWEPDEETQQYKERKTYKVPSPGDGQYWEQIEGNKYVLYDPENDSWKTVSSHLVEYDDHDTNYTPMLKTPWLLPGEPEEYGLDLWDEVKEYIKNHVDFPDESLYDVATAWVFCTWLPELFNIAPYIRLYGTKNVGKTRGLEVFQHLVHRGVLSPSVSEAALFRLIQDYHVTYLLDETEIYGSEQKQAVQHVWNAGYRRGQQVLRCEQAEDGSIVVRGYDPFGPKAAAGTRLLKDTFESRCIPIIMEKNTRDINFILNVKAAKKLRNKLLLWRFRRLKDLKEVEEVEDVDEVEVLRGPPEELREKIKNSRIIEIFAPLITLADTQEAIDNIVEYAEKTYQETQDEEAQGPEAQILYAITQCRDRLESRGRFATQWVADYFNQDKSEKERWKNSSIGKKIKALGFKPKPMNKGYAGYIYDADLIDRLKLRYPISEDPPLNPSTPSTPLTPSIKEHIFKLIEGHEPIEHKILWQKVKSKISIQEMNKILGEIEQTGKITCEGEKWRITDDDQEVL